MARYRNRFLKTKNKMNQQQNEKSKYDMLREMQIIAEEIERNKIEVEKLLSLIDELEIKYFELAEKIKKD